MGAEHDLIRRITLVTDSSELVGLLAEALDGAFAVCSVARVDEIAATRPDLLMVDLWHVDNRAGGWPELDAARATVLGGVPAIVYSSEVDGNAARAARRNGTRYLQLPFGLTELEQAIAELLDGADGTA